MAACIAVGVGTAPVATFIARNFTPCSSWPIHSYAVASMGLCDAGPARLVAYECEADRVGVPQTQHVWHLPVLRLQTLRSQSPTSTESRRFLVPSPRERNARYIAVVHRSRSCVSRRVLSIDHHHSFGTSLSAPVITKRAAEAALPPSQRPIAGQRPPPRPARAGHGFLSSYRFFDPQPSMMDVVGRDTRAVLESQ